MIPPPPAVNPMGRFVNCDQPGVCADIEVSEAIGAPFVPGTLAGAVKSPVELIVPVLAVQVVAPAEVNCWVLPSCTVAEAGKIVCATAPTSETAAVAEPLGPEAVTETLVLDGRLAGAV